MTSVSTVAGNFQFILGNGPYQAELVNRPSRPLSFVVDGRTTLRLEFIETTVAAQPTRTTPTASPTGRTQTLTPAATSTVVETTTPTLRLITPTPGTPTPTPVLTPVPDVGTPISLVGSAPTARPLGTPPTQPLIRRAMELEVDLDPWVSAFLYGTGIGAAAIVFYLVVVMIRR